MSSSDKAVTHSEKLLKLFSSLPPSSWAAIIWQGEEPEIIATAMDAKTARSLAEAKGFKLVIVVRAVRPSLAVGGSAVVN